VHRSRAQLCGEISGFLSTWLMTPNQRKNSAFADHYQNPNKVKSPHFEEGKIPLFRIGALLI